MALKNPALIIENITRYEKKRQKMKSLSVAFGNMLFCYQFTLEKKHTGGKLRHYTLNETWNIELMFLGSIEIKNREGCADY